MNKILVIADRLQEEPLAITHALKLADAYDAHLHVVYFCCETLRYVDGDKDDIRHKIVAHVAEQAQQQLEELQIDKQVSTEVVWAKHIHQWVNDYVDTHTPSLVVKTGHRSESLLYTSTDWHLLRECQSPVLITNTQSWRRANNVLAAIDLASKNSQKQALNHKVLSQAKKLADFLNVEMHVCYVPHVSPLLRDLGVKFMDEEEIKAEKNLDGQIEALAAEYELSQDVFHIHAGLPHKVIPSSAADFKAGIVVMGTVGRTKLAGKVVGNTAEKVLSLLKTHVLAIKP